MLKTRLPVESEGRRVIFLWFLCLTTGGAATEEQERRQRYQSARNHSEERPEGKSRPHRTRDAGTFYVKARAQDCHNRDAGHKH